MDDFIIGYIEGGLDYDYHYDDDLHRDLELELGNDYDDGPFAALANAVDLLPHYDHEDDYGLEYYDGPDRGGHLAGLDLDEQSVSTEGSGGLGYHHRYESSVPESIEAPSQSDTASEDLDQHSNHHISEDDSEEEAVIEHYGIPFQGRQHFSDEESEESDYGSLPSSDVDQVHDYAENEQVEDSSQDGEGYQSSEDDEVHPPVVQWDPLAEIDALSIDEDEILAHLDVVHESDDSSQDQEVDDFSDDELLATHYNRESSSQGQRSNTQFDDDDDSLRSRHSHHLYSDSDAEEEESSASESTESSASASPSEGSSAPPSPGRGFLPDFDPLPDLADLHQERQRLQEDLRRLRAAHFGIQRRANAPNDIDYFLDRLPAPQRDAHGLLAQMEMDLERGRQRRRAAPSPIRAPPRHQQQREPAFIDLTGDSDSPPPEVLALPDAPRFAGRDPNPFAPRDQIRNNPRRNNPARRAPSFARSDGSFLGPGGAQVIDLTSDAPDADPPPRPGPPPRRRREAAPNNDGLGERVRANNNPWGAANMNALFRQMGIPRMGADFLQHMRVALGGGQADYEVEFIGENIRPDHHRHHHHVHHGGPLANFPIMENPLADNPVDFNYGANGINNHQEPAARPKPAHIAPPEPREGFTRATGEDTVVICPSCEEELSYDPDGQNDAAQPPPAKKAKTTRKDREEHHFWAVKACGHVYCRSCYENRRPTTKNAGQAHFQVADKRVLCAVEGCSSDVSTKTAWVGIFL